LGLSVHDLDESKSQIAHGESVRETAVMISFMAEALGIRDDLFIGKGHAYMCEVADAVETAYQEGVLQSRPVVVNLQCDIDHPTQTMADLMHLADYFGGLEALRGKTLAMSWAYSPSYGKPLSVPQGVIGLMTRFGMNVRLAHPKGYGLIPEVGNIAAEQAAASGGSFSVCGTMDEAFEKADIVYPKSWAPYSVMEERTSLVNEGKTGELQALEKRCLERNAAFTDWECNRRTMALTNNAIYLHCLPADISGVSCETGEVSAEVFEQFRVPLYKQAGYKPYVIAAAILASKLENPAVFLSEAFGKVNTRGS
jgi:knotted carbamoyltransferase YgeW